MSRDYRTLSASEVAAWIDYRQEDGAFCWAETVPSPRSPGARAERKAAKGYLGITIAGAPVLAHRLAWFIVHGEWPSNDIDHLDGCRQNNAIANLRHVTRAQNMQNLKRAHRDTASQLLGAYFDRRRGTWSSRICKDGDTAHLGTFSAAESAHAAYLREKRAIHECGTL